MPRTLGASGPGNLRALEVRLGDEARETLRRLGEPPETYWAKRSALPWN